MHVRAGLALVCLVAFVGCRSSDEEELKEFATIELKAMPDMNPNDRGEPTPLDVRIYKLKEPNRFTQASFEELWVKDEEVLGATMAERPEVVTLEPSDENAKGVFKKLKLLGGRYIGLMALYSGQSESGLEERKICVNVQVADGNRFEFTGHRIVLAGGGLVENASSDEGESDGEGADGAGEGEGESDGDGESDVDGGADSDEDESGDEGGE